MEHLRPIFARHGLRWTAQREEVLRALASTKAHPTAEELFQQVTRKRPGMSLATVYNTLDAFTRRGLCRRLSGFSDGIEGAGPARYDADMSDHVHFVCDSGRVRDVPGDVGDQVLASLPPDLIEQMETRMGVRVDRIKIEFVGKTVDGGSC